LDQADSIPPSTPRVLPALRRHPRVEHDRNPPRTGPPGPWAARPRRPRHQAIPVRSRDSSPFPLAHCQHGGHLPGPTSQHLPGIKHHRQSEFPKIHLLAAHRHRPERTSTATSSNDATAQTHPPCRLRARDSCAVRADGREQTVLVWVPLAGERRTPIHLVAECALAAGESRSSSTNLNQAGETQGTDCPRRPARPGSAVTGTRNRT
jgi:hypothetical protein